MSKPDNRIAVTRSPRLPLSLQGKATHVHEYLSLLGAHKLRVEHISNPGQIKTVGGAIKRPFSFTFVQ